jgi:uncharacterized protein
MKHAWGLTIGWCVGALTCVLLANPAAGQQFQIPLDRPGPRDFIVDKAELLAPADETKIRAICDKLLTDKATPIIVVTIDSMAPYVGEGMRVETFAMLLFNQWQIGQAKLNGQSWNTGVLLLISKHDRKARIELGGYWRHDQDALAESIMGEQIIPRFKQGDYAGGILAGVESLDKMARGLKLPTTATSVSPSSQSAGWMPYVLMAGAIVLVIFTAVSLARSGSSGWAWLLWGALFAGLGYFLYQMFNQHDSDGGGWSGGDFGGGSFGGGFSGGGGATGSW